MGRRVVALLIATSACGPVVGSNDDASSADTSATTTDTPTTATPSTTADPTTPTSLSTSGNPTTDPATTDPATTDPGTTVDPSDTTSVVDPCGDFIGCVDVIVEPPFCDIWAQDCFRGAKCMPWADDGGTIWNGTRCSPLEPNPAHVGDPCTVEGSATSGIDDCDIGSMCFFVDPDTNQGTCVSFCMGNVDNPICEDPANTCAIEFAGALANCLPSCDPLLQDCARGGCYATSDALFVCAPTFDIGLGAGQTCDHEWECAPGYTCHDGTLVPDCEGDRCCAPLCDLTVPGQCEELTCEPLVRPGQGPGQDPPYGVCVLE